MLLFREGKVFVSESSLPATQIPAYNYPMNELLTLNSFLQAVNWPLFGSENRQYSVLLICNERAFKVHQAVFTSAPEK